MEEMICDREYRVPYQHANQKVQWPNSYHLDPEQSSDTGHYIPQSKLLNPPSVDAPGPSMYPYGLRFQCRRFEDIPKGDEYVVCWNPAYERRPAHVNELYGTNPDDTYLVDEMEDLTSDSEFDPEDELDDLYKTSNGLPKSWTISGITRIRVDRQTTGRPS